MVMPKMGGKKRLELLLKLNPRAKTIVVGGLTVNGDTKTLLNAKVEGIVFKPFDAQALLRCVRDVLDAP